MILYTEQARLQLSWSNWHEQNVPTDRSSELCVADLGRFVGQSDQHYPVPLDRHLQVFRL